MARATRCVRQCERSLAPGQGRGQKQSKEANGAGFVRPSLPLGKGWPDSSRLPHPCPFPPPVVPNRAFIFSLSSSEMRKQASESVSWRICGNKPQCGWLVRLPQLGTQAGLF